MILTLNPKIADTVRRVAFDGSNRHSGAVLPVIRDAIRDGTPLGGLALSLALWARMCEGTRTRQVQMLCFPCRSEPVEALLVLPCEGHRFADDAFEGAHSQVKRDSCHNWFNNTLASRLNDPKTGAIIIVAQRLNVDDLVGRLSATGNWEVFNLPAIATQPQDFLLCDNATWHRSIGDLLHPERISLIAA